jgi:restriction system protein
MNKMTITDAIIKVIKKEKKALSHKDIYEKIVENNFYVFGAKDPVSVVGSKLRKHCYGLDFPSASPKKLFIQNNVDSSNRRALYELWDGVYNPSDVSNVKAGGTKVDLLPEEKVQKAHSEHLKSISNQLLEYIKLSDPEFFETLVVKLLLKMGYGWDQKLAGQVIGGAGDGGIDGVISEDKLGLEKIYIQAKRYKDNKVKPSDIRDFIGAMAIKGARKGVFFTSSTFTEQAIQHSLDAQNMTITLVNGDYLTELLVQYELGLAMVKSYKLFEVDKNFFSIDE